jgi:ankyrin repeat protein
MQLAWQTMLHMLCRQDKDGKDQELNTLRAGMLLDAGANISAKEDQFSATPLGWAALNNNAGMLRFLLSAARRRIFPTTSNGNASCHGQSATLRN